MFENDRPELSIVIPSFNHADYVEAAVRSVLDLCDPHGPGPTLELVVVDDGSSDDSLERLEALRSDARLEVYSQENRGAHSALNRAIELSRGAIVFVLNSDDTFKPQKIPAFLERFAKQPNLRLVASWLEVIDQDGGSLGVKRGHHNMPPWPRPKPGAGLADLEDPELALLETNYISTTSNLAFRRSVFEGGTRFLPLRFAHDWDFMLAACSHGSLEIIEDPLVCYRVHSQNTIKEGQAEAEGQMRFEILWVVARHAMRLCRDRSLRGYDSDDLHRRLWNSLPRFGYESILSQLMVLRGVEDRSPASYDALLDEDHAFRRAAIRVLSARPSC